MGRAVAGEATTRDDPKKDQRTERGPSRAARGPSPRPAGPHRYLHAEQEVMVRRAGPLLQQLVLRVVAGGVAAVLVPGHFGPGPPGCGR